MTAYVVLHDHPLRGHGGGPEIMVTRGDVAAYRADNAAGQSVVVVRAGERLTERQALEGVCCRQATISRRCSRVGTRAGSARSLPR
jgi:D-alanyl-D-alanine carboxypeptidase (penicillin-binding protein 5/6)